MIHPYVTFIEAVNIIVRHIIEPSGHAITSYLSYNASTLFTTFFCVQVNSSLHPSRLAK